MISKKQLKNPLLLLAATAVVVVSCMKMSPSGSTSSGLQMGLHF
jgi:quinoprotein glucose dehydrogenase